MKFHPKQKSSNFRLTFKTRSAITTIGLLKTCAKARTWTSSKLSYTAFSEHSSLQKWIVNKKSWVKFHFDRDVPSAERGVECHAPSSGGGAFSGRRRRHVDDTVPLLLPLTLTVHEASLRVELGLLPPPSPPKGCLALTVGQEVVQRLSQGEKTVMEAPHP